MKHIKKIEFDEDLVLIMTSFININKRIPEEGIAFFLHLKNYLKKNKALMLDLFELLNAYIMYGNDLFLNNQDYTIELFDMIKKSFGEYSNYEKSAYLGYNLLSVLLQVKRFFFYF